MIFSKNLRCIVNEYDPGTEWHDVLRYDCVLGRTRRAIKQYQSELILQYKSNTKADYRPYGRLLLSFDVFDNPSRYIIRIQSFDFNYHNQLMINYNTPILTKLFIDDLKFLSPTQDKTFYLDGIYYLVRETDMSLDDFKDISELLAQEISTRLQGDGGPIA